uniref:Uncharacterized protein n=1 Tax=Entomoneis paludosa TaxID=265537 RepID=A0A7S2YH39_9STRA|mmetsp:Transcript_32806/g.68404  ORF Transcript_32806/g.68404 Transcript_32806/m.68404 type:complete len:127 (+) Transcript_32806:239-619(+)
MIRSVLVFLLLSNVALGWMSNRVTRSFGSTSKLLAIEQRSDSGQNPCWEDLYDDDCAMSNVYAASFVASEWIKSMPCAAGLEDCDMPADLQLPDTRHEAGVEQVDVMDFLGLKRAKPIDVPKALGP